MNRAEKPNANPRLKPPVSERDHRQGPSNAPVTLVEFGDYECPYCAKASSVVKQVQTILGDQLQFSYRNFPLTQLHPHAQLAAEAAEAAGAQGKFWQMHDALYLNQQSLDNEGLLNLAINVGLNIEQFLSDLNERAFASRVAEDIRSAQRSGVNGTPTFYINALRYDGTWDFKTLLAALQIELVGNAPPEAA